MQFAFLNNLSTTGLIYTRLKWEKEGSGYAENRILTEIYYVEIGGASYKHL
jgi:hypothetical protein